MADYELIDKSKITHHNCEASTDCEFAAYGAIQQGQDCQSDDLMWRLVVLDQCVGMGGSPATTSVMYKDCVGDKFDTVTYSANADCTGSNSTTAFATSAHMCVKCDASALMSDGGAGGGTASTASPTASKSSGMPRFKGLVSAGLLSMAIIAFATM